MIVNILKNILLIMAWINKNKSKYIPKNKPREIYTNQSAKFYGTKLWKQLREYKLLDYPLCLSCLQHGRSVPATTVHHITPFLNGKTLEEQWKLFTDYNNLFSLCNDCHIKFHQYMNKHHLDNINYIPDEEYYKEYKKQDLIKDLGIISDNKDKVIW